MSLTAPSARMLLALSAALIARDLPASATLMIDTWRSTERLPRRKPAA